MNLRAACAWAVWRCKVSAKAVRFIERGTLLWRSCFKTYTILMNAIANPVNIITTMVEVWLVHQKEGKMVMDIWEGSTPAALGRGLL
ncbi:MAG: hypothetical protein N3D82_01185 [Ignisphaera sp.]|nr:hypothetical protein [Ignisphaera sp.]MCX8167630.1 hypothetical protein [Ignisphaera sp.]MDW8085959.1 hypothetical protein [Ignisphaera sp.]